MKKVLFLFDKKNPLKDNSKDYEDLYSYLFTHKIAAYRSPVSHYNKTLRLFNQASFFEKKTGWLIKKNLKPALIFDKTPHFLEKNLARLRRIISNDFCFVNDLNFSSLLSNKWNNYRYFQKFYPKTILIKSSRDFFKVNQLKTDRIILKPLSGSSGKGIKIQNKINFKPIDTPFIAQEIISSFGKIPGLVAGPHDLRIMLKNQTPFYSYLRIPQKGKFLSNLAKGGKLKVVPLEKIPHQVLLIAAEVSKKLKNYKHKFYSIDFILDSFGKPWIIEMNSRPGLVLEKEELKYRKHFYDNLVDFINKAR